MNPNQIKIIPILIMVAMMAFSVRLVDFSLGVSSLSGSAFAAKEEKSSKEEMMDEKGKGHEEMAADKKSDKKDDSDAMMAKKEMAMNDEPDIKWRDAKDETTGAAGVRLEVMDDLSKRRTTLDKREKQIIAREALLRAAQQELDRKYQELSQLRVQIEELLGKQSEEEQARISSLVKIYEGMKPKDAARIFDTLDLDVLVSVMSRMSERKLSPVLASMNPERARTVTIMLAEEKKLPSLP